MTTLREQLKARRERDAEEYRHANLAYHDSDGVDVAEVHKAGAEPRDELIEKLAEKLSACDKLGRQLELPLEAVQRAALINKVNEEIFHAIAELERFVAEETK